MKSSQTHYKSPNLATLFLSDRSGVSSHVCFIPIKSVSCLLTCLTHCSKYILFYISTSVWVRVEICLFFFFAGFFKIFLYGQDCGLFLTSFYDVYIRGFFYLFFIFYFLMLVLKVFFLGFQKRTYLFFSK